ncbi:hypothetical protein HMPREF0973_01838 [Prevotella veroralis F0319]|uniref:Uncharacterized protein n=1 Tax=Prevotella veroralis F0319 TaxID=649761 RepID=C9MQD8_9BACT|nr:hypothetical protein HMPREF0973_01838 [Prevotella veroralis F0319]
MSYYRRYSFFIHRFSNAAKVVNKRIPRGFSLPNVHYAERENKKRMERENRIEGIFTHFERQYLLFPYRQVVL